MVDAQALLAELGFGEYEAKVYVTLLARSAANGYEVAKLSGIPRANVYAVLQKLEDRGAVVRMETAEGTRYAAVPVDELLAALERRFKQTLEATADELTKIAAPPEPEPVWNVSGYELLLEHARSVIAQARNTLLVAVWPQESRALAAEMGAAAARGVRVGTLCLAGCARECGACRGSIHRHRLSESAAMRALVVVADDAQVAEGSGTPGAAADMIAASIAPGGAEVTPVQAAAGIRTRQLQVVSIAASYIRHSIALAAVVADLGPRLADLVDPATREALALLVEANERQGWLAALSERLPADRNRDT